jgi:hypothetical protein
MKIEVHLVGYLYIMNMCIICSVLHVRITPLGRIMFLLLILVGI